ncbi:MAG TPA: hypothetical protein VLM39_03025, partial [Ignavibacteriaceae bacterium]|nr:hypothetical protein [Ignavibacteriaceae bacterium]
MKKVFNKFHDHWFAGYYLKDLSLIRLVVVGVQLYFLLFMDVLTTQKLRSLINIEEYEPVWILKILLAPFGWGVRPDFLFLEAIWLGAVITGFLSLVGLYKRPILFLFAAFNTILFAHKYSYLEQHHTEAIVVIFLWILAFGDSSKSWSIDDLKKRIIISLSKMKFEPRDKKELDQFARWPVTLMQWMFCLVYLSAGYEKVKGGFNSYSLMGSFAQDGIAHQHDLGLLLSGYPDLLNILVPLTVIFEFAFILIMLF